MASDRLIIGLEDTKKVEKNSAYTEKPENDLDAGSFYNLATTYYTLPTA